MRALHNQLEQGNMFVDQAIALSECEQLRQAIALLQGSLNRLRAELQALVNTETYRILSQYEDWEAYFDDKEVQLETAIAELGEEVACHDE